MPRSSHDILAIITSEDIDYVNFDTYLLTDLGQIIYDKNAAIANTIFSWGKKYHIECCGWTGSSIYDYDIQETNEAIINFCDKAIFFWNEKNDYCLRAIEHAEKIGVKYIVHIIK